MSLYYLGMVKQVTGEGMPTYRRPYEKGHLFIHFELIFPVPNWTSGEKLAQLEAILPPRRFTQRAASMVDDTAEDCVLSDADPRRVSGQAPQGRGNAYDEDEDEGHGQAPPGVQCAQQ